MSPRFARLQNTAGVTADWDLNDIIVTLGYDHSNLWVLESEFEYLSYQSDTIAPQVAFTISPTITAGVNTAFSDVRYDQNIQNDYTSISAGPYVTAQLSD